MIIPSNIRTCSYFTSRFHVFDATIIIVSFIFEVSLQGVEEEVASLIIILRLLRVVKIIDEISVGAAEEMKELEDKLEESTNELRELREEVARLRYRGNDRQYSSDQRQKGHQRVI